MATLQEIIVVDGGSTDRTLALAREQGALTIQSPPGRSRQMNAGASKATGHTLLFLHADTRLPKDWLQAVTVALGKPGVAAGAFRFQLRGDVRGKSIIEASTNWRSRWFHMPYGDQGLFLHRTLFEELGGYADLPLLEDFELVSRLRRRGRIVTLQKCATTSGRRWETLGMVKTTLVNQAIIAGYYLGVPIHTLAAFYRQDQTSATQGRINKRRPVPHQL